jgi:hypothetical protein
MALAGASDVEQLRFADPSPAADRPNSSKSEKPTGTPNQVFFSTFEAAFGGERTAVPAERSSVRRAVANFGANGRN